MNKLSLWTLAGIHIEDVLIEGMAPSGILGLEDGDVLVNYPAIDQQEWQIPRYRLDEPFASVDP